MNSSPKILQCRSRIKNSTPRWTTITEYLLACRVEVRIKTPTTQIHSTRWSLNDLQEIGHHPKKKKSNQKSLSFLWVHLQLAQRCFGYCRIIHCVRYSNSNHGLEACNRWKASSFWKTNSWFTPTISKENGYRYRQCFFWIFTTLWQPKCTCFYIELKNLAHHRTSTGQLLTWSPELPTFATCTTHISAQFTMRWFPSTYLLTSRAGTIYLLQRNAQMTAMQKKMSMHNGAK